MPVTHWLKITSPTGTLPVFIAQNPPGNDPTKSGFSNLAYSSVLNGFGICTFTLNGNHQALSTLVDYALVEVWRYWPELGINPYVAWSGIFRDEDSSVTIAGGDIFSATCVGDQWWLSTRAIAYYSGLASRSLFTAVAGETIMKTLVNYNAGPQALATNLRDRDAVITGISLEADGAHGNVIDWACSNENLLANLQKLAPGAGGDFDLIKTGPQAWQFKWYTGQRGTDRTATVKFSIELGNMGNPRYVNPRSSEKTVALVKGQGTGSGRAQRIRTGANYTATNNIEFYVNASSQASTNAALDAAGDAALKASQAAESVTFDALPFPGSVYGKHWFLGDKVGAKYKAHSLTPRIVMVTTTVDTIAGETVSPLVAVNV